ncbi:MAG: NOB1 family endonuclease [Candidatus Hermodarchaeota archaeon]
MNVTPSDQNIYVLDATAFIGLNFPILMEPKTFPNASFFTTPSVASELKDFRSKMNLEAMKESGLLQFNTPIPEIQHKITNKIKMIDPQSTLSRVDIDILTITLQLKGILITNDFTIQNMAHFLKIPIKSIDGKKITNLRMWQLKCKSCGKNAEIYFQTCPHCGGQLKRKQISRIKEEHE